MCRIHILCISVCFWRANFEFFMYKNVMFYAFLSYFLHISNKIEVGFLAILDQLKKYYKMLPVQLTIVNQKAAQIASLIYEAAIEQNTFAENEDFNDSYGVKLEKYIVYYDIGKYDTPCGEIRIGRTTTELEVAANRKYITILEDLYKDAKLSAEEEICKEILYYAIQKGEQFDGMGYPQCLKGTTISPLGRILSVADYVAGKMADCMDREGLVKKLRMKIGKKFDPDVVPLAIDVVEKLYAQGRASLLEETGEFRSIQMIYQPIVDTLASDRPKYNEAFICLNDEKKGIIMPEFYAPIAERNARMLDIAKYGFEFLFEDIANNKYAPVENPRTFFVNVSAECLSKPTFMAFVKKMIRDYGVNPRRVVFEVDTAAIDLYDAKLLEGLKAYRELGIRLAIDNYGAENSSLTKLQNVEFDIIKIDRGLIDRICDDTKSCEIVKSTVKMARELKVDIIAKGVDTAQQKALLMEMKCFYMQGRLFGEPDYLSI